MMIKKLVLTFCLLTAIAVSAAAQQPQQAMNASMSRSMSGPTGGGSG